MIAHRIQLSALVQLFALGLTVPLIAAGCSSLGWLPRLSSVPAPSSSMLPAAAALTPAECGWPASTPLAFAGWATVADLSAQEIVQGDALAHVYALVSRERIEIQPMVGSPMHSRGFCALLQSGAQVESGVPDDWAYDGAASSPVVTCQDGVVDCARETLAVLDAVDDIAYPATRITFRPNAMCIWYPFITGAHSCPAIILPRGTRRVTNAVVSFSGTDQQAFLNLFWLANGSISSDMALVTPPPGATPFP